jgi:hypothetical protein
MPLEWVRRSRDAAAKANRILGRLGYAKWLILGLILVGVGVVLAGAWVRNGYWAQVFVEVGATLFIAAPLVLLERVMESRFRYATESVKSEVAAVRRDVKDARVKLDELGQATDSLISETRLADADAIRALREDVTEPNTWRLLQRAYQLGAIDAGGVRVRLPETSIWIRFSAISAGPAEDSPTVQLCAEQQDATILAAEEWTPEMPAKSALARIAEKLMSVGRYPGDEKFDAVSIFGYLIDTLDIVLPLRTRGRTGGLLGPVVELVGEWAVTADGLEHLTDEARAVTAKQMLDDEGRARTTLLDGLTAAPGAEFDQAFETATEYHRGLDRLEARRRVPRG